MKKNNEGNEINEMSDRRGYYFENRLAVKVIQTCGILTKNTGGES